MYKVIVEKAVIKQLQKIPQVYYHKVKTALTNLGKDPRPNGYLKLEGREGYRIRVGDYGIIYDIKDDQLIILIVSVAHRKDVYEK
jgi:mRNA interferase RelE/StbE